MSLSLVKVLRRAQVVCLCFFFSSPVIGEEILVAVASNFSTTAARLAEEFEGQSGHQVTLAFGSTGHHYAQIVNGAPFDVFLAADEERPRLLEESGNAVEGSRFTYAFGQLVLWSADSKFASVPDLLRSDVYQHLALANPRFAPYGRAAMEVLEASNMLGAAESRIVLGENVGQTLQFVESGAAELGFVSLAQINSMLEPERGFIWQIEPSLYSPIRQQAVLVSEAPAATEFISYLKSEPAKVLIFEAGYSIGPL